MRNTLYVIAIVLAFSCTQEKTPASYVNVFNGSGLAGNTYPGATTPFGAVQLSPDTEPNSASGYKYRDSVILGFSHTHLSGTGCPDFGDFLITPGIGKASPLAFIHADETAYPGYYSVRTKDLKAELTATAHTGVHRYTFFGEGSRIARIDANHCIGGWCKTLEVDLHADCEEIIGHRKVTGWAHGRDVFLSASFSEPFLKLEETSPGVLEFTFSDTLKTLTVYSGISGTGIEGARLNRISETSGRSFDDILADAQSSWDSALGMIKVKGGPSETFYTYFYHTFVTPNRIDDADGLYRDGNGENRRMKGDKPFYSTFSLWDTFRAWHPLQTILDTTLVGDMVASMLDMYRCRGELPVWPLASDETGCMIGYHSVSVIADAWLRGVRSFDGEKALAAMVESSCRNDVNTSELYINYGWIPANFKIETVSKTLEYAYDDWCIARMAEALGHEELAARYDRRAMSYREIFDPETGFMRAKNIDGSWSEGFNQLSGSRDYTEATPWQYRFFIPHDMEGMSCLLGGKDKLYAALDSLFTYRPNDQIVLDADIGGILGQYAQGNEPGHNFPWLFHWAGAPSRSQETVRWLLENAYSPAPDGICGNEDCGQMGAWYVLASIGLYPACPGSGEYILTAPLFRETTISLANGKTFTVKADHPKYPYIADVFLNGKQVRRHFITYEEIMNGGELSFKLSGAPCHERDALDAPYSLTKKAFVSQPAIEGNLSLFDDYAIVSLSCRTEGAQIRYTLDGSEPTEECKLYTGPFTIGESCLIQARAFKEGFEPSVTAFRHAHKQFYRPSARTSGMSHGCRYTYHEANFKHVGQLEGDPAEGCGIMAFPDIKKALAKDHFGYVFTGYIDIPEDGIWSFATVSDDGSALYIDGVCVLNNDVSGAQADGVIPLMKGLHPYKLLYFDDCEGEELSWLWKAPSADRFSRVSAEALFF